jgi:hypothetical protein
MKCYVLDIKASGLCGCCDYAHSGLEVGYRINKLVYVYTYVRTYVHTDTRMHTRALTPY